MGLYIVYVYMCECVLFSFIQELEGRSLRVLETLCLDRINDY